MGTQWECSLRISLQHEFNYIHNIHNIVGTQWECSLRISLQHEFNYIHSLVGSSAWMVEQKQVHPPGHMQCVVFLQFSSVKVQSAQVKCSQEQSTQWTVCSTGAGR